MPLGVGPPTTNWNSIPGFQGTTNAIANVLGYNPSVCGSSPCQASNVLHGAIDWGLEKDKDGHRDYFIDWLVQAGTTANGPLSVLNTAGLPAIGSSYAIGNDSDPAAFCWPDFKVKPVHGKGEIHDLWIVTTHFSTHPIDRCQCYNGDCNTNQNPYFYHLSVQGPLQEPWKLSGTFFKFTKLADKDRFGDPIESSSHETLPVQVDDNRPTVVLTGYVMLNPISNINPAPGSIDPNTQEVIATNPAPGYQEASELSGEPINPAGQAYNVENAGNLTGYARMVDTVNAYPMWGLPPRTIKLSNISYQRVNYGLCQYFFAVTYEFDIRYGVDGNGDPFTFDERVGDTGTRVLSGWSPGNPNKKPLDPYALDPTMAGTLDPITGGPFVNWENWKNFEAFFDIVGGRTITPLDGAGRPPGPNLLPPFSPQLLPATIVPEYYPESDFSLLGIPLDITGAVTP